VSEHAIDPTVPRGLLLSAGALVLASLIAVTLVRLNGVDAVQVPDAVAVTTREFLFQDREDGSILVLDARTKKQVESVAPGSNGFLRGTMRGLARERKRQGVGADVPFQLVGRADGRLTLIDPATKRRVDLESFGPTNAAVFAKLIAE
jgi:putative photosynthetic complex assembly protein